MRCYYFIIILITLSGCGLGDYTRELGNGYTLERSNSCCIFIKKEDIIAKYYGDTMVFDTRIIKPLLRDLYLDDKKIVGYKINNKCCYLTEDERAFERKNGYFIIYKSSNRVLDGLSKRDLLDLNISIKDMKKILENGDLETWF